MSQGEIFLTDRLKEAVWTLNQRQSAPGSRDGGGAVVTYGRPFWTLSLRYENLDDAAFRQLSGWIARRDGARVTFTAYRPSRPRPLLAPSQSNAGLGVSSVNASASTVSLTGLGSTVISPGDMIGFYTSTSGYWIGEAVATATPSGGAATVTVKPYPQTPHASTPNVRLYQAIGEFQLSGLPQITEPHDGRRNVAINAVQVVRT